MITYEKCLRLYRFYEAMALYDLYYDRLAVALEAKEARPSVTDEDRPITWVPLIFHCTSFAALEQIHTDGFVRPSPDTSYVSLTELPIDELARLRGLGARVADVAIGFPRSVLENQGLFQPAYLKHSSPQVKEALKLAPPGYVELDDDLGALHEVRVPGNIALSDAVWILSSARDPETGELNDPRLKKCSDDGIALSYWHPSHQRGIIQEPSYRLHEFDAAGNLDKVTCRGEHYRVNPKSYESRNVILPAGKSRSLRFPKMPPSKGWDGPFTKFEMAEFFYQQLKTAHSRISLNVGLI